MKFQLPFFLVILLCASLMPAVTPVDRASAEIPPPEHPYIYPGYDHYVTYTEYENRIYELQAYADEYADGIVHITKLATNDAGSTLTYDGHSIYALKISDNAQTDEPSEPSMYIVGEHHAREWLSVMVPLYFAEFLVRNYGMDSTDNDGDGLFNEDPIDGIDNDGDNLTDEDENEARITELVDEREIWIIPMLNPDGYIYDGNGDRDSRESWRKNREPNYNQAGQPTSYGTDLNRNYAFRWGEEFHMDSEGNVYKTVDDPIPASQTYRGAPDTKDDDGDMRTNEDPWNREDDDNDGITDEDKAGGFSTAETRAMRLFVEGHDRDGDSLTDFSMALSYHSYGEYVLYPWAWTPDPTEDSEYMHSIGLKMADLNHFPANHVGAPGSIQGLYTTSGDWMDWMYGTHYTYAFTIELSGYGSGFYPTEEHIIEGALRQLPVNLYAAEVADDPDAEYDPELTGPDVLYNHTRNEIKEDDSFTINANVFSPFGSSDLSVTIHYAVSKDASISGYAPQEVRRGEYKTVKMHQVGNATSTLFRGSIPEQDGGKRVWYYISAEDAQGKTDLAPEYGKSEPFSFFVDKEIGISGIPDSVALIMMIIIFYGIVWGGFGAGIRLGFKQDKIKGD